MLIQSDLVIEITAGLSRAVASGDCHLVGCPTFEVAAASALKRAFIDPCVYFGLIADGGFYSYRHVHMTYRGKS